MHSRSFALAIAAPRRRRAAQSPARALFIYVSLVIFWSGHCTFRHTRLRCTWCLLKALAEGPGLSRSRGWVVTKVDVVAAAYAHRQEFSRAHASAEPLCASSPHQTFLEGKVSSSHHTKPRSGAEDKGRKYNLEAQVKRIRDSAHRLPCLALAGVSPEELLFRQRRRQGRRRHHGRVGGGQAGFGHVP